MTSESRKNKRKKKPLKSDITKRDKVIGILIIAILVIVAATLAIYVAFATA